MTDIPQETMTSQERQKYALLGALVVIGIAAIFGGLDPLPVLTGLAGLFAGVMIDPHAP
jgi:hypothetical protein